MAEVLAAVADFRAIAWMWVRAALAYPTSFWMLSAGSLAVTALDFVAIWILFGTVDVLGGFTLTEVALLYGATGLAIGVADLLVGSIERLGARIRLGTLDAMMTRPVPLLVQVCADEFALRRLSRIVQAGVVFTWGASYVDWTVPRGGVAVGMLVSGSVIFLCLFISFGCVQFWTAESSEVANAFTYGGNTVLQVPLSVYPAELVRALTFVLPVAFVNWYPCLYLLGRADPFGLPAWLSFASPVAAAALVGVTSVVWRSGVRHYTSTGS